MGAAGPQPTAGGAKHNHGLPSLIVGASGLVGGALLRTARRPAIGTYRTRQRPGLVELDASDPKAFAALVERTTPEVIYLPAAQPDVDWCERNPDAARYLNLAPIINALRVGGSARLIGYSSDYVFDGREGPYTEDSEPRPLSVYGRIKRELEELLLAAGHTVIRTTTVFGLEQDPPKNFALRLAAALRRGETVRIPADQWSTPTFADDLATASARVAGAGAGLWHLAGSEFMARDQFARKIAAAFEVPPQFIRPVPTVDLDQAAPRPLRAGLRCARFVNEFGSSRRSTFDALLVLRAQIESGDVDHTDQSQS